MPLAGIVVKVMPESPEVDLESIKKRGEELVHSTYGEVKEIRTEEIPIAFGLRAVQFTFIVQEELGSDIIQEKLSELEGVASATVTGFQRLT